MFFKDIKNGEYKGFKYLVRNIGFKDKLDTFHPIGLYQDWYCGYVEIPKGHDLYEIDFLDLPNEYNFVHGGLSYSGFLMGDDRWFIGFDCNHAYDNPEIHDDYYTYKECKKLINIIIDCEGKTHEN